MTLTIVGLWIEGRHPFKRVCAEVCSDGTRDPYACMCHITEAAVCTKCPCKQGTAWTEGNSVRKYTQESTESTLLLCRQWVHAYIPKIHVHN